MTEFHEILVAVAQVALTAFFAALAAATPIISMLGARWLSTKLRLDQDVIENIVGERFDGAVLLAIDYAKAKLEKELRAANPGPQDLLPVVIREATGWLERHYPETTEFARKGRGTIAESILARLPLKGL